MKKLIVLIPILILSASNLTAAAPTEANLFWTGNNQSAQSTLSNWSTSATEILTPSSVDWGNTVIGHMDFAESGKSGFINQNTTDLTIKGIYWGSFENVSASTLFHIYQGGSNGSITVTDGITLDMSEDTPYGKEVRIRRRNGSVIK